MRWKSYCQETISTSNKNITHKKDICQKKNLPTFMSSKIQVLTLKSKKYKTKTKKRGNIYKKSRKL